MAEFKEQVSGVANVVAISRASWRQTPLPKDMSKSIASPERIPFIGCEILSLVNDGTARHIGLAPGLQVPCLRSEPILLNYLTDRFSNPAGLGGRIAVNDIPRAISLPAV